MRIISGGGGSDSNTLLLLKGSSLVDSSKYERALIDAGADPVEISGDVGMPGFGDYYDLSGSTTATARRIDVDDRDMDAFYNDAFCLEWWGARGALTPSVTYWASKGTFASSYAPPFGVYTGSSNRVILSMEDGTGLVGDSSHLLADTDWHHYAVERAGPGADVILYIDGVLIYQLSVGAILENTGPLHIGGWQSATSVFGMNGYLDDLRLSRVVRYGGEFSPPGPHRR